MVYDKVLKDLIETNIRQRRIGNPNPIKLGRCIKELENLADELGIDVRTMQNYKKLTELVPKLEELSIE